MADITILTPTEKDRYAGIVTFQKQSVDNVKLYQHLQANDVLCAYRGDGIRFSPHFHTPKKVIDRALTFVSEYADPLT
jgi:selenocysteine lyase/cysteine desulfurase